MAQIAAPVGVGAANAPDDVRAVQMLLNRFQPHTAPLLSVDGIMDPPTAAAIGAFFISHVPLPLAPVIAPASAALRALNGGPGDRIAWGLSVDAGFKSRVITIAFELVISVDFLMAAMAFETGETFSPSVRNPASGATGLIQFTEYTAEHELGTHTAQLAKMTAIGQLGDVYRHFRPYRGKLPTLDDVYMAVLFPSAIGKGADHILFSRGSPEYSQNAGLDLNKDGAVTVGEATAVVRRKYNLGVTGAHLG